MRQVVFALLLAGCPAYAAQPVRVIFDTDMGNDIDDALALAMLHGMESRGESKLLAVTLTKDNRYAAPYVDLVNHFYGREHIPVGVVKNGKTPEDSNMIRVPCDRRKPDGSLLYPRKIQSGAEAEEAVSLLRRVLSQERDGAVVMVQVGFFTNFARLIEAPADRELVRRKVKLLVVMAGAFPSGQPEYNVRVDIPAAKAVFASWPTPIVASGFEIGLSILYPATSIEMHYRSVDHHPIADAYRAYKKMPYDRPTWDLTAVLYAVRTSGGYFTLWKPGRIGVDEAGKTSFVEAPDGPHRYLLVDAEGRRKALEQMINLASRPPDHRLGIPVLR